MSEGTERRRMIGDIGRSEIERRREGEERRKMRAGREEEEGGGGGYLWLIWFICIICICIRRVSGSKGSNRGMVRE